MCVAAPRSLIGLLTRLLFSTGMTSNKVRSHIWDVFFAGMGPAPLCLVVPRLVAEAVPLYFSVWLVCFPLAQRCWNNARWVGSGVSGLHSCGVFILKPCFMEEGLLLLVSSAERGRCAERHTPHERSFPALFLMPFAEISKSPVSKVPAELAKHEAAQHKVSKEMKRKRDAEDVG